MDRLTVRPLSPQRAHLEPVRLGQPLGSYRECSRLFLARMDESGALTLLSAAWERVLGYSRKELGAMSLADLTHAEDRRARPRLSEQRAGADWHPVSWTLRRRDGRALRCRWHRRLDPYDGSVFVVGEALEPLP